MRVQGWVGPRQTAAGAAEAVGDAAHAALTDRAHYSSHAFGLDVPRRPWSRWQIAGAILAVAALVVVAWRWFSNR